MKEHERPLKALANRRRLMIVKILKTRRSASVGELAVAIRLSLKATSKHLSILSAADILEKEQVGVHVIYRISDTPPRTIASVIKLI